MKCTIPEISWHNRDPVLSVDIQPKCSNNQDFERLATGGTDSHVLIWHITVQESGAAVVVFAADLTRHQKAVNVVRFSPSGEFLASGDDESAIIVWKQKTDTDSPEFPTADTDGSTEQWLTVKVLRGHVEDVYDLAWSPDSGGLVSGSVDNTAILWDVRKGVKTGILADHKGFVQGVAWDPCHRLVATLASDRTCRVYSTATKKAVCRTQRAVLPVPEDSALNGVAVRLYHDDTFKSFFRRLTFSPDGQLLITPSGVIEDPASGAQCNATFIYTRQTLNRPSVYLPSRDQFTIAVKCCPLLLELRSGACTMLDLPYRMIIAVAEQKSVVLYDTQQSAPFAIISNIHYTRLTDLTWSSDGCLLVISSTDGYCSVVTFDPGELGVVYKPSPVATVTSSGGKTCTALPTPGKTCTALPTPGKTCTALPTPGKTCTTLPTPGKTCTVLPTPGKTCTALPTPGKTCTALPTPVKTCTALPSPDSTLNTEVPTPSNKTSCDKTGRRKSGKVVKRIQPTGVGAPAKTSDKVDSGNETKKRDAVEMEACDKVETKDPTVDKALRCETEDVVESKEDAIESGADKADSCVEMKDPAEIRCGSENVVASRADAMQADVDKEDACVEIKDDTSAATAQATETAPMSPTRQQVKVPSAPVTPLQKTPRRVAFVTISSPKSKKKLM